MMMRTVLLFLCIGIFQLNSFAQAIKNRIIFIGDAGEINDTQTKLIAKANELVLSEKTKVFFLGDNIYPDGMELDSVSKNASILSLESQYQTFRKAQVPVYFIAGNHDWNVSRVGGLVKLKAQEDYLLLQQDANLKLIPKAGEPGPVSIPISDKVIAIVYDSEYWLYPHHEGDEISVEKRKVFLANLSDLITEHSDKQILLVSHHPMESFGEHGLSFGLKQHIFPLTRFKSYLYFPLPILGSLYPLYRKNVMATAEDLPHPIYQDLISDLKNTVVNHKNIVFVSGHDHGLQFINHGDFNQIVSGSGSKTSYIRNHKNLMYKYQQQGFSVLDEMDDNTLIISFYIHERNEIKKSFQTVIKKK